MTIHRIEALSDGIFAIAMTLLILSVDLPNKSNFVGDPDSGIMHIIKKQSQEFFNYALSFILLANFWVIQHLQFHFFQKTNTAHLWINIFLLMFVTLVPYTTSLVGDYSNDTMAELLFSVNMLAIGIIFVINWSYASKNHRLLHASCTHHQIMLSKQRGMVIPIVSLVAMALAFIKPVISSYVFLTIPLIIGRLHYISKKKKS